MDTMQILIQLLEKPDIPKFYRQLAETYKTQGKINEAEAISHLIEMKFEKKYDEANNCDSLEKK